MTDNKGIEKQLIEGYNRMLERVKQMAGNAEKDALPVLKEGIEHATETAHELGELTKEEAERVAYYLRRDLQDAAGFVADSGKELGDWLRFDLQVVEQSLADIFNQVVDRTRTELQQLEERATAIGEWHTGEIVSIGTLECKGCGELLHFHHTSHIPPCPKCHGTTYRRISMSDE